MKILDSATHYGKATKILHWIRLLFLVWLLILVKTSYINLHKAFGIIFFVFVVGTIVWRIINVNPKTVKTNVVERNIQVLIYFLMYFLLFFMPIVGYLSSFKAINFGFFMLPSIYDLQWVDPFFNNVLFIDKYTFRYLMQLIHTDIMVISLYLLVGIHVLAVVFNHFVRKNGNIKHMM